MPHECVAHSVMERTWTGSAARFSAQAFCICQRCSLHLAATALAERFPGFLFIESHVGMDVSGDYDEILGPFWM